jgi:hypothetical protein
MSARNEALYEEFTRWLGRYSPRRTLQQNEQALGDEINALMRMVLKMAPSSDYLRWLEKVTTNLDFQMKTSAWPTVAEVGAACSNMNKHEALNNPKRASQFVPKTPMQIAAKRMNEGDAVGDEWLYGRSAVELIEACLVPADTMRKYRSALYFAAKDVWGEDIAKRREAEWIAKHESAEDQHRKVMALPEGEPFKRMPTSPDDQWAAE